MKEQYLKILGLNPNSSEELIKKAYRKLAKQYHPDVNDDPNSHNLFIKINEAYAALMNEEHEQESIDLNKNYKRRYNKPLSEEEFEERMQWARNYAKLKDIKEQRINKIGFIQLRKSYMNWFSVLVSVISVLVATTLLLDYAVLVPNKYRGLVMSQTLDMYSDLIDLRIQPVDENNLNIGDEFSFKLGLDDYYIFKNMNNDPIFYYCSPILNEALWIKRSPDVKLKGSFNHFSIYSAFYFYVIILYFPIITLLTRGPNAVYIIAAYFFTYISLLVMFVLFSSILFG